MEATLVHFDHIDAVLTYAVDNAVSFELQTGETVTITRENATDYGRYLLLMNLRCCQEAYRGAELRYNSSRCAGYYFIRTVNEVSPAQIAKCIDVLKFTGHFWDVFEGSPADALLDACYPAGVEVMSPEYNFAQLSYIRPRIA